MLSSARRRPVPSRGESCGCRPTRRTAWRWAVAGMLYAVRQAAVLRESARAEMLMSLERAGWCVSRGQGGSRRGFREVCRSRAGR